MGGGGDNVARAQTAPPAPDSVSVANGSNTGEAVLSWTAVANAYRYRIGWMANDDYVAARAAGRPWNEEFRYSDITNRGQTSRTITRLTPGIYYHFIVGSREEDSLSVQWSQWAGLQLAGPPAAAGSPIPGSTFASSASRYQAIEAGKNHTCGIKLDNTVVCWGDNTHGQANAPQGQFLSNSAGGVYSCGINFENRLVCWGHAAIPAAPDGNFTDVAVGDSHACAVTRAVNDANRIICWGLPNNDGRTVNQATPYRSTWLQISAGSDYNCARSGRGLSCWGNNPNYYLNDAGSLTSIDTGNAHICGRWENAAVGCRGNDVHGQVSRAPNAQDEGAVEGFYTYRDVSAGGRHTCGVRTTGNIRCWGDDLRGQASPPGGSDELQASRVGIATLRKSALATPIPARCAKTALRCAGGTTITARPRPARG